MSRKVFFRYFNGSESIVIIIVRSELNDSSGFLSSAADLNQQRFDLLPSQYEVPFCCTSRATYSYRRAVLRSSGSSIRQPSGTCIRRRIPTYRVVCWQYSAHDQPVAQRTWRCDECSSVLVATVSYEYDERRQLIRAENADAMVRFEYDESGRLAAEYLNGRKIQHQWDVLNGTPCARQVGDLALTYAYGQQGELTQLSLSGHQPLQLRHDRLGREIVRESAAGFIQACNYTATGLLANQAAGRSSAIFRQQLASPESAVTPALHGSAVSRSWHYDRAYNVAGIDDWRWGKTHYHHDLNDQIVRANFGGFLPQQEQFSYDASLNLTQHTSLPRGAQATVQQAQQQQRSGRVISRGNCRYRYDEAGRLAEKRELKDGFRPRVWRYRWNEQDQLAELMTPEGERWRYAYDAFGRRIRKLRLVNSAPELMAQDNPPLYSAGSLHKKIQGYDYLWSGDQLIEETPVCADGTVAYGESIHWLYAPGALTPVARYEKGRLHYVVADHMGTPRELLNEQGKLVWATRLSTWGKAEQWRHAANDEKVACHLRFAGQYADDESGLHYNRFRYYDTDTGQYLCPDPIGLLGGVNTYAYVHNPLSWVDPLGLAGCSTTLGRNMMEAMGLPRSTKWTGYQAHHIIPKELANHPALMKIKYYIDDAGNGIFLRKVDDGTSAMARHQGNHDGYTQAVKNALDKIDLNQSKDAILNQVKEIQGISRKGLENGYPIRSLDMDKAGGALGNGKVNAVWTNIFTKGGW